MATFANQVFDLILTPLGVTTALGFVIVASAAMALYDRFFNRS